LPKFYFPDGNINAEVIKSEEILINQIFNKDEINIEEFVRITVELLGFPKMFNTILFDKINKGEIRKKILKSDFLKY
jgi:hypothetical protein